MQVIGAVAGVRVVAAVAVWLAITASAAGCERSPRDRVGPDPSASSSASVVSSPRATARCDVVLTPFGGPTTVVMTSGQRYCVGDVVIGGELDEAWFRALPKTCTWAAPPGAYRLSCQGFYAYGGGPIANLGAIVLQAPTTAPSASTPSTERR